MNNSGDVVPGHDGPGFDSEDVVKAGDAEEAVVDGVEGDGGVADDELGGRGCGDGADCRLEGRERGGDDEGVVCGGHCSD